MPTFPQDPERAHKTRCSCTVLWPRPSETSVFHAHAPGRGSLWNAAANLRAAARLVYYRHREKPPRVPLPSALLPWPPCGTCPSTPSQKLNWTRWRLYVTGLGLQLRATDPGGVRVNYKTVSLGTALVLLCTLSSWTAARVIYSPGRSDYRAQSCCRGSLNHHISSCHPQHLVSFFWQCELQETAQRANSKDPFLHPKEIKDNT